MERIHGESDRLRVRVVVARVHVPAGEGGPVEVDHGPYLDARALRGLGHYCLGLLPAHEPERQVLEFVAALLALLFLVDIGDDVVHVAVLGEIVRPERLPLVGIAAQPVADDHAVVLRPFGDVGQELDQRLVIVVVRGRAERGEVQIVRPIVFPERQPLGEVRLLEDHLRAPAVDGSCLIQQVLAEINALVDTKDVRCKEIDLEVLKVGVALSDAGEELVPIGGATPEVHDPQALHLRAAALDEPLEVGPQVDARYLVLPVSADVVIFSDEPRLLRVEPALHGLRVCRHLFLAGFVHGAPFLATSSVSAAVCPGLWL